MDAPPILKIVVFEGQEGCHQLEIVDVTYV